MMSRVVTAFGAVSPATDEDLTHTRKVSSIVAGSLASCLVMSSLLEGLDKLFSSSEKEQQGNPGSKGSLQRGGWRAAEHGHVSSFSCLFSRECEHHFVKPGKSQARVCRWSRSGLTFGNVSGQRQFLFHSCSSRWVAARPTKATWSGGEGQTDGVPRSSVAVSSGERFLKIGDI